MYRFIYVKCRSCATYEQPMACRCGMETNPCWLYGDVEDHATSYDVTENLYETLENLLRRSEESSFGRLEAVSDSGTRYQIAPTESRPSEPSEPGPRSGASGAVGYTINRYNGSFAVAREYYEGSSPTASSYTDSRGNTVTTVAATNW